MSNLHFNPSLELFISKLYFHLEIFHLFFKWILFSSEGLISSYISSLFYTHKFHIVFHIVILSQVSKDSIQLLCHMLALSHGKYHRLSFLIDCFLYCTMLYHSEHIFSCALVSFAVVLKILGTRDSFKMVLCFTLLGPQEYFLAWRFLGQLSGIKNKSKNKRSPDMRTQRMKFLGEAFFSFY